MKQRRLIICLLLALLCGSVAEAQNRNSSRREGRIDREIRSGATFAYKGEYMLGLTASYGTLSSEDTNLMVFLDDINLNGSITSVKPFFGYFYRDNRCVGLRLGYQYLNGELDNLSLDLGEQNDISMNVGDMNLLSNSFSTALFHRSYLALDQKGQFGLFAEIEGSLQYGEGKFINGSGEDEKYTRSENLKLALGFNPGIAVYIFPSVCATVSVGLGGLRYTAINQFDEAGVKTGSRHASKMQFRINVADINFGLVVHLWNKKKMAAR